jgi:hypothetical protein
MWPLSIGSIHAYISMGKYVCAWADRPDQIGLPKAAATLPPLGTMHVTRSILLLGAAQIFHGKSPFGSRFGSSRPNFYQVAPRPYPARLIDAGSTQKSSTCREARFRCSVCAAPHFNFYMPVEKIDQSMQEHACMQTRRGLLAEAFDLEHSWRKLMHARERGAGLLTPADRPRSTPSI